MADDLMYSVKLKTKNDVSYASFGRRPADSDLCDERSSLGAQEPEQGSGAVGRSWRDSGGRGRSGHSTPPASCPPRRRPEGWSTR